MYALQSLIQQKKNNIDFGKRFSSRATPAELVQKNILKEDETSSTTVASTILQTKISLEEEKRKEQLNRRLSNRPTKVDLKLRNILRVESVEDLSEAAGCEPDNEGLIATQETHMSFEVRSAQLRSILKKRPEKSQLEGMNILKGRTTDPSIVIAQEKLKRAQIENALEGRLRDRPNIEELEEAKIIIFSETVEVLPTFRKSEYNRKPDANATFKNLTPQMKVQIREELNTFKKNEMSVHEDIKVNFWDVGGDPIYFDIRNEFYKDTHGAMLVVDVSTRIGFDNIGKWMSEMHSYANTNVILFLVASKTDIQPRMVESLECEAMAREIGAKYFETSAATGDGVIEMFDSLFQSSKSIHFPLGQSLNSSNTSTSNIAIDMSVTLSAK
ncbi:hypothetical protein BSLG_005423 [Batrachochytrium salamandrivorans]|nr:hypothetical protein BSLG_005423 [Batrachochytrium salamandrivorans]